MEVNNAEKKRREYGEEEEEGRVGSRGMGAKGDKHQKGGACGNDYIVIGTF